MNLLAGKLYDPAVSVSKATTALLAMTALDTTNLRLAFTVPPSGIVRVRLVGVLHGATTYPQIVLGVLEGATVRGRMAPMTGGGNLAATSMQQCEAIFVVTGLTPGASLNWDAAYGVETVVAATGLKYGGPNNTTANDNFGGFAFEIWDPCPTYTPTAGAAPTTPISTRIDTIDDFVDTEIATLITNVAAVQADTDNIQTRLPAALVGGRMDSSVGAMAADVITAAATAADFGTEVGTAVWATATRALTDKSGFSLTQAFPTNFSALAITVGGAVTAGTVNDKTGYSLTTAPLDAAGTRAAIGLASANLDTQLSTIAGYIDTEVAAIKAKTDSLTFTVAGQLDANIQSINDVTITGNGQTGTKFGV